MIAFCPPRMSFSSVLNYLHWNIKTKSIFATSDVRENPGEMFPATDEGLYYISRQNLLCHWAELSTMFVILGLPSTTEVCVAGRGGVHLWKSSALSSRKHLLTLPQTGNNMFSQQCLCPEFSTSRKFLPLLFLQYTANQFESEFPEFGWGKKYSC